MNLSSIQRVQIGSTKEELVQHLVSHFDEGPYSRTTVHGCVRGNTLWCVESHRHRDLVELKLAAYELNTVFGEWGYTATYEGKITRLTCPLSFLDVAPEVDPAWREQVRDLLSGDRRMSA